MPIAIATPKPEPGSPEARDVQATETRKALVKELTTRTKDARTFWKPTHERIREDIRFAGGDQWQDAEEKMADAASDKYQVNFVQRELNQQVSAIFAKNPTVTCERRKRLEYQFWDGSDQTLMQAQQILMQAAPMLQQIGQAQMLVQTFDQQNAALPPGQKMAEPPQITQARQMAGNVPMPVRMAQAVMQDHAQGVARKTLYDKIAATAELVFERQLELQEPDFETQMKGLVLREKTTGAGFVTVKFQRQNETVVTSSATHADVLDRINLIHGLVAENDTDDLSDAQKEQLALELQALLASVQDKVQPRMEGIILDFKPTTSIIVDPKCRSLFKFVGADWITEELLMTPEEIQEQWGVDVRSSAVSYANGVETRAQTNLNTKAGGAGDRDNTVSGTWPDKARACVWIIQDKAAQMQYVVCDGYDDFLEEPAAPWPSVSGFWTTIALKLNLVEVEENHPKAGITIYGQSAVRLLKPMQEEMNRTQEALREHRIANRPGYVTGKDTFDKNDAQALANRAPHDVIPLNNVPPGGDVSKVLVPIPSVPIDPRLYETSGVMQQAMLVTGMQQANMGAQSAGEKATGQAIAEQSRVTGVTSEADSLDKFLREVARVGGEMNFREMSLPTVQQIAGPGAAWPNDPKNRSQINEAMFLKVEAGSMGRPNRAMEVANLQAMMPQLVPLAQMRGLPLDPLVKYAAKILEFDFDVEDWLASGTPQQAQGGQPPGKGGGASESIAIKLSELTPQERAQALAMAGIQATPGSTTVSKTAAAVTAPGAAQGPAAPPAHAPSAPAMMPGQSAAPAPTPGAGLVKTMLTKAQNAT